MSFAKQHSKDRAAYAIVAIRFNSPEEAGDWNTFHEKTANLERHNGMAFRHFLSCTTQTTRMAVDWGIHELPTTALINPDGNLVPNASLSALESALKHRVNNPD